MNKPDSTGEVAGEKLEWTTGRRRAGPRRQSFRSVVRPRTFSAGGDE
jgi:hypothetical protein